MIVPGVAWQPVTSHSGAMNAHMGLVLHVQEGNSNPFGWFANPNNQASSTWWISKTGELVQYVDSDLIAWAQASYNGVYNSVETEGFANEPLTNAQILTCARLYVWGHNVYGWPLTVTDTPGLHGLITHGDLGAAGGGHTGCPGDLRKAQRAQVIYIANLVVNPSSPTSPTHQEPEMHAVVMPNGDIKIYAASPQGHLMEFTRHDGDQFNSVIDITAQIGGSAPFLVAP